MWAVAASSIGVLGCGGDAWESSGSYRDAMAARECEQFYRCEGEDDWTVLDRARYTEAQCRREEAELPEYLEALLESGTVRFDSDAAKDCLESYDDICAGGWAQACSRVYVGTVPDGLACGYDVQCASGECSADFGDACGTCIAAAPNGATCSYLTPCRPESYCDYSGTSPVCRPDELAPIVTEAKLGESCEEDADTWVECAPGLFCDEDTERCTARLAAGLRCDEYSDQCADGTICMLRDADAEPRCAPLTITDVVGADCGERPTGYVECDASKRMWCNEDDVCEQLAGNGKLGSRCEFDSDCESLRCAWDEAASNAYCVAGDLPVGAPCREDSVCETHECGYEVGSSAQTCLAIEVCSAR